MGCFRHLNEIIGWQSKNNEDKHLIIERSKVRSTQMKKERNV